MGRHFEDTPPSAQVLYNVLDQAYSYSGLLTDGTIVSNASVNILATQRLAGQAPFVAGLLSKGCFFRHSFAQALSWRASCMLTEKEGVVKACSNISC